jgi:hypothetical protein
MRIIRLLGWYCTFTAIAAAGMLVYSFPNYPKTLFGWALFLALALPIILIGEVIGSGLWKNHLLRRIDERTDKGLSSFLRIVYGVFSLLLVFAAAWGVAILSGLVI